ncbi:MAG: hypothetical protein GY794_05755 [bacterium]|nr:hypothetical protein [bacterium]
MHIDKTSVWLIQLVIVVAGMGAIPRSVDAGPPSGKTSGLHIKQSAAVNFRKTSCHVMADSLGSRWDIQYTGAVYRGTSHSYSGGMQLQVGGATFHTNQYQGWTNKEGELELGPWKRNNLTVYRRIKAYKNLPFARWLDILENPTSAAIKVQVTLYSHVLYSITQRKSNSGQAAFGTKDWAVWTRGSSTRSTPTLHVVTTPEAKVRPKLTMSGSQIYVRYNLTIPAGKTVVLCHFESQNRDTSKLDAMMKKFPRKALLKDLSGSVRRMILNIKAGGGVDGVELDRHEKSDRVVLGNGDLVLGSIANKSFKVSTVLGEMELPVADLVGMAAGEKGQLRFVMTDGQVVAGTLTGTKLNLTLTTGGKLNIPIEKIKQWSFQITKKRPDDLPELGQYAALNTGDMLAIVTGGEAMKKIRFQTVCGEIELDPGELLEIRRDRRKGSKGGYLVLFRNGSILSGNFAAEKLALQLKLGKRKVDLPREKVELLLFSEDDKPLPNACQLLMNNGDKLMGQLSDKSYELDTDFGKAEIASAKFKKITFKQPKPKATLVATIEMLNGTILRGLLNKEKLGFRIGAGVNMGVPTSMVKSLVRPKPQDDPDDKDDKPIRPPGIGIPVPVIPPNIQPEQPDD